MSMKFPWTLLLGGGLFLAGCQTVTVGHSGGGWDGGLSGSQASGLFETAVMPAENDSSLDPSDPCVNNMENLTGALLAYAGEKRHLPDSLSELPATFAGEKLNFSCPVDGKPYTYYPFGLRAPPELAPKMANSDGTPMQGNLLILVDAEPVHEVTQRLTDGTKSWSVKKKVRYGIVMAPPHPPQAIKMYVIPVEQALLDMYVKEQKRENSNPIREIAPGGAF